METEIVKKIVSTLHDSPKSINQIAEAAGIGWGTCEKYLESLKLLGVVEETRTARERVFSFRERRRGWLYPHARRIIGNRVERSDEIPPESGVKV
ncbi:MAG: winged helix-turn-helix domain-containing protein [Candidatus Bathyarchaeia archaeon]